MGVRRGLWRSLSPTLLLKPVPYNKLHRKATRLVLNLHNFFVQLVPVLCYPHSKEDLPHVQTEISVFQFVPITPCLVTAHH